MIDIIFIFIIGLNKNKEYIFEFFSIFCQSQQFGFNRYSDIVIRVHETIIVVNLKRALKGQHPTRRRTEGARLIINRVKNILHKAKKDHSWGPGL